MRVGIFKFVFFSIISCSFEYVQNELHYVNERSVSRERNIINFRSNRILAYADNQFDLNNFYESNSSLESQFNGYNDDCEEIINLRNIIDSHIKKHRESNTRPNLNNANEETKKFIHELRKELEEAKKELDNISSNELEIQPIHDKRKLKKGENISVSEHENFKQFENRENILESENDNFKQFENRENILESENDNFKQFENRENILESENYNFENKYHEIASSDIYKEIEINKNPKKKFKKNSKNEAMGIVGSSKIVKPKSWHLALLLTPSMFSAIKDFWKIFKFHIKKLKKSK
ncbi:fam-b protein [Plasmodium vinckei brucechwatti]|uniref:Fam-b protein n=1 Tax=Plasmodium vinckei brucechwatti TaxID=119398 RepID=A0A6V7RVX9_PLAVN|nr:fam-b protein [Plasmodium vinckei brucechwatti]